MSLFESLAIRRDKVEFLAGHFARLEAACRQCGWPLAPSLFIRAGELLRSLLPGPVFARIYVTAGDGDPGAPVVAPRIILLAEPRAVDLRKSYRVALRPAPHVPLMGGLKTANYWANVESRAWAHRDGFDEALLFNTDGALISACMANVFAVFEGELVTPHPSTGARPGLIREWVMQRYTGSKIVQRALTWGDLDRVTECFLTSSWNGVVPVTSLDARPLQTTVAEALKAEFWAEEFELRALP
jgi:branched-subunit amino acid aminotransferase/4-amino-4-deoxychorismate lyase